MNIQYNLVGRYVMSYGKSSLIEKSWYTVRTNSIIWYVHRVYMISSGGHRYAEL
jgi:hypothetical protein